MSSEAEKLNEKISAEINKMIDLTNGMKSRICDIERNLLIAQDAFTHAKTLTQNQVDLMVTE